MKIVLVIAIILGATATAEAQVAPEATSPFRLAVNGTVNYSARYGQMAEFYNGTSSQMADLSGDIGYSTTSERAPTSVTFGIGDNWSLSGTGYNSGPYENLALSQGIVGEHWSLQLIDDVGYRKGAPITGFTGAPGSGEPISSPNPTPPTDETILTLNTAMLNNDTSAQYSYKLSAFTSLSAGGGYNMLRFLNGGGIDTNGLFADMGVTRRLDARNTLTGQYSFSHFSYSGAPISFDSNTATIGWTRRWNRRVSSSVSAGPQFITGSGTEPTTGSGVIPIPSSTGLSANASVSYDNKFGVAGLAYSHGVVAGGGYQYGGEQDSLTGSFGHQFGHEADSRLQIELAGGYRRTGSLNAQQGTINAKYGSAQATKNLGRYVTVFANYTGTDQTESSQFSTNVIGGLWQVISFGIGYTPRPIHLRH